MLTGCAGGPGTGVDGSSSEPEDISRVSQATTLPQACMSAPVGSECRYQLEQAFASSVESHAYRASHAIDGDCGTRWSSAFCDPQWLKVDLGSSRPVSRLIIRWEIAASSDYEIQVSDDTSNWTKVATKADATITGSGNSRVDTISGLKATARYVRVYSLARATSYGNSIFELEVFGTGCSVTPGCSQIPVVPIAATASSQEHSGKSPEKAIDGDSSTRWSSSFSDPQWLQLDLGQSRALNRVVIDWEHAASSNYELQLSDSPTGPWIVAHAHNDNRVGPRTDDILSLTGKGRYLRIHSTQRATAYGNSIFEVRVFRGSCTGCEQVLTPTAVAASSSKSHAYAASKAADDNYGTRWSSKFSDPQWLRLDFGQAKQINQVIIRWGSAASRNYRIEGAASSSGPWQVIAQRSNQPPGPRWDFISGLDATARFLRVYSTACTSKHGNSIVEIIALGSTEPVCSGHGQCTEDNPPGQKVCVCDPKYQGDSCASSKIPDSDGDTKNDLDDGCPLDPLKTEPLICGCGVSEVDTDLDKVPDCEDFCPSDPTNQIATPCGCAGQNNFQPAGARCIVEGCSGSRQEGTCDGAGQCGVPECAPLSQGCSFVVFRDHGYWFCEGDVSWQQAEDFCGEEPGRSLAQVNDRVEDLWLSTVVGGDTWLGGNALADSDSWAWSYGGVQDRVPFWVDGLPVPGRYTRWQSGLPSGAGQCLKLLDNGSWADANCGETHGFVCEQPVLRSPPPIEPPCACDFFPGVSCDSCGAGPQPQGPCVEGTLEFPHTGGNPDLEERNPDFEKIRLMTEECRLGCSGPDDANCATACQGFTAVPTGTCLLFTNDEKAFCDLDPATISETDSCTLEKPFCATPGLQCGRRYECAALESNLEPRRCQSTINCASGQYCNTERGICIDGTQKAKCDTKITDANGVEHCVGICFGSFACGLVQPECALNDDGAKLDPCSTTQICPDPNTTDFSVDPFDDARSNLTEQTFPANDFFPVNHDEYITPFPDAKPDECGDASDPCHFDTGEHPWCNFDVDPAQTASKGVSDDDPAFGDKQGSAGSAGPIRFDFDPNLDVGFNITNPLPMGDAEFNAHARASATAGAHFSLFGINGAVSILDAVGGLTVDRCGVSHEARLKLFGLDFLPAVMDAGAYAELGALDTPANVRAECQQTLLDIQAVVDRAQKALRDAQELIRQQRALVGAGKRFSPDLCHQLLEVGRGLPADFPRRGVPFTGCGDLSPEDTINLFIEYYRDQVALMRTELERLVAAGVPDVPKISIPFLGAIDDTGAGEVDEAHRETQQIANINFAIGPIPMNLTIEAFVKYGMAGNLTFGLTPSGFLKAYDSESPESLATVDASLTPYAGAGVGMFLGVGFDWGALSAKVGISGEVSLGLVTLPIYAGAGINVRAENEQRPLPLDMAGMVTDTMLMPKGPPKKYSFEAAYKFGVSADISQILQGTINAKLRIQFFWFSKSWQKQIASFGPALGPIHIPLINGGGGTEFADGTGMLGFIHMPLAFVDFIELEEPPALPPLPDPNTGGTGGTGTGGASGAAGSSTGGTGTGRPPISLLVEGDPRYVDLDYSRVERLFYDGYCECNDGAEGACSSNLDCCSGSSCVANDFGPDKFCLACIPLMDSTGRGSFCETTDQCCDKATGATCRAAANGNKYCQGCIAEDEPFISGGSCCPGTVVFLPPVIPQTGPVQPAAGPPICTDCRGLGESCNDSRDCCSGSRCDDDWTCGEPPPR